MILYGFRLLVRDFAASVHFWRDVVKFAVVFESEPEGYTCLKSGKTALELLDRTWFASALGEVLPVPDPQGRQMIIDLKVDDVDVTYAHLVAEGAIPVAEPTDRPAWGMRTAHIADPDNNVIELYKPLPGSSFPEI